MLSNLNNRRGGFTLVEIMIVVSIIALLAAIAVPSFLRARKRSQATATLETLRMLDGAIDQWAIENGKSKTDTPTAGDLKDYVKSGTKLHTDLTNGSAKDALNNPITLPAVDTAPKVPADTRLALDDVLGADVTAQDAFWGAYK